MCGHFTRHYTWRELVALYRPTRPAINLRPRYNIAATTTIDAVIPRGGDRLELVSMRWGLGGGHASCRALTSNRCPILIKRRVQFPRADTLAALATAADAGIEREVDHRDAVVVDRAVADQPAWRFDRRGFGVDFGPPEPWRPAYGWTTILPGLAPWSGL